MPRVSSDSDGRLSSPKCVGRFLRHLCPSRRLVARNKSQREAVIATSFPISYRCSAISTPFACCLRLSWMEPKRLRIPRRCRMPRGVPRRHPVALHPPRPRPTRFQIVREEETLVRANLETAGCLHAGRRRTPGWHRERNDLAALTPRPSSLRFGSAGSPHWVGGCCAATNLRAWRRRGVRGCQLKQPFNGPESSAGRGLGLPSAARGRSVRRRKRRALRPTTLPRCR